MAVQNYLRSCNHPDPRLIYSTSSIQCQNLDDTSRLLYLCVLTLLLGALLVIYSCVNTLVSLKKRWRQGGGKRSTAEHPDPFSFFIFIFLVCEKSLTLWFFHSFLLILVLAPQFYPRCIASKERKTERVRELVEKACMVDEHKNQNKTKEALRILVIIEEGVL